MISKENSLSALYPNLAKEWHPTRNGNLTPDKLSADSQRIVWWRTTLVGDDGKVCLFDWASTVYNRTHLHMNCPMIPSSN